MCVSAADRAEPVAEDTSSVPEAFVLRVESLVPGDTVEFECAVAFGGKEGTFRSIKDKTPFELRLETDTLNALVHVTTEGALLVVTLVAAQGGQFIEVLSANCATIVLGENLVSADPRFIRCMGSPPGDSGSQPIGQRSN
jgi:hypothetical protein